MVLTNIERHNNMQGNEAQIEESTTMSLQLSEFISYFSGAETGYGQHDYKFVDQGKEEGRNFTVKDKLVTAELYQDHIEGKRGLGIVPVRSDGKCKFTVMDIDVYDSNLDKFIHAIDKHGFPLVPFKSKSGGLHIYMFFRDFVDAREATDLTKRLAKVMSLDMFVKQQRNVMLEIFPKQIVVQEGRIGNWINLPYYNAKETKQPAVSQSKSLSLENALMLMKERVTSLEGVHTFLSNLPYNDAPPCLQSIYLLDAVGKNEGRNNYLFSFGAYFQKKDENFFEQHLMDINNEMQEPLSAEEIENTIISSLNKRSYNYRCTQAPCVTYCNKVECRQREFGVGKDNGYFTNIDYGKLKQYKQEQPYYEWEVRLQGEEAFKVLRFRNESEIIKQEMFQQLCVRELYILPPKLKNQVWAKIVTQSLAEIEVIRIEEHMEMGSFELFKMYFVEFLNHSMAKTLTQIEAKRVYKDDNRKRFLFRAVDLLDFLYVVKGFRSYQMSEIHAKLRDLQCFTDRIRTDKKVQIRVYCLPFEVYYSRLKGIEVDEGQVQEISVEDTLPDMENKDVNY